MIIMVMMMVIMMMMIMIMVMMMTADPGFVLVDNPVTYQRDIVDDDQDCNDGDS